MRLGWNRQAALDRRSHQCPIEPRGHVGELVELNQKQRLFNQLWTECQRCQGSFHQTVLCTSRDCPVFYARQKVQKDLKVSQESLDKFNLNW